MKPSSALFLLILLSCVFLISHVSAAEKKPSAKPLSQAEQKSQPDIQKDESQNQKPPAEPIGQKTPEPKKQAEPQKPQKHWYDFFTDTTMPNWLIIAGWALASFIAWRTLRSLNKQVKANIDSTNAAIKAAKAAEASAEAAKREHRAQLIASIYGKIDRGVLPQGYPNIDIQIQNMGKTPAYDCIYETWMEVTNRPFTAFSDGVEYRKETNPITVYPDMPIPTIVRVAMRHSLTDDEAVMIAYSRSKQVSVRIRLTYRDIFNESRFSDFAYGFNSDGIRVLPQYSNSN